MVFRRYKPVDDIIAEINSVTAKSVQETLRRIFDLDQMGAVLMGGGADELRDWFLEHQF
jgi:predicted Zn-dependent peptidase